MPKRTRKEDFDKICKKIKKLERKLNRARHKRSTSESSKETTPSLDDPQDEAHDDMPNEVESDKENTGELPHNSDTPAVITIQDEEGDTTLDTEVLQILGDDPSADTNRGAELHKEVASRLEHLATCGLTREQRKELQEKYPIPINASKVGAPILNSEIKAALNETSITRDKAIEAKQKLLGCAISCLGATLSKLLESNEKNTALLGEIMNATRILCDIQHSDSITRRRFSSSSLKKEIKDHVQISKIDNYLFGETLAETLRAAKAVSKSGAEIKTYSPNTNKIKPKPNTFYTKNWKGPPARRPPAPQGRQENREPVYRQNQPNKHFKPSSHMPKQPRRR